jgi:beta propeller repeat protein
LNGGETRITTNTAEQVDPAISGSYIVFTDSRNGNKDIFLHDLLAHSETNLTSGTPTDQYLDDIDGVRVVYTDVTAGASDIHLYDISTSAGTPLTSGGNNYAPTVDGDHVVWVAVGASARNVILADLVAWSTTSITANPMFVDVPRVDGDWVVWEELVGGKRQIKAYRVTTAETRTLTTDASDHRWPDVSGSLVVWADNRNGNWDIYSYDLDTSALTRLTTDLADQQYPRISATRVVWEDSRSGTSQIWTLDLETGVAEPLSPSAHPQVLNAIDGSRVVWTENRYPTSIAEGWIDFYGLIAPCDGTISRISIGPVGSEVAITSRIHSCTSDVRAFVPEIVDDINSTISTPDYTATLDPSISSFNIYSTPGTSANGYNIKVEASGFQFTNFITSESMLLPSNFDIFMFTIEETPPQPVCGDGTCNGTESCSSCPADCGVCPPACGDGTCNGTETCSSCPQDCGACPPVCGDGTCNGAETCSSCSADCGECPVCGDGLCNGTEDCTTCLEDCGVCPPVCGDGSCNGTETCVTCQEDCGICPTIFVSPLDYNFGEVKQGASSKTLVTITNLGANDLTVSSIAPQAGSSLYFTLTPVPSYPIVLGPNANVDIGVTFAPMSLGDFDSVFEITSTDPKNNVVDVSFKGTGVKVQVPPSQQIQDILAFFDSSVANGTLLGNGPGNSANGRRNALRNMLKATGDMINQGDIDGACGQLKDAYLRTDGIALPPDFVKGPSSPTLVSMIQDLMATLGCN